MGHPTTQTQATHRTEPRQLKHIRPVGAETLYRSTSRHRSVAARPFQAGACSGSRVSAVQGDVEVAVRRVGAAPRRGGEAVPACPRDRREATASADPFDPPPGQRAPIPRDHPSRTRQAPLGSRPPRTSLSRTTPVSGGDEIALTGSFRTGIPPERNVHGLGHAARITSNTAKPVLQARLQRAEDLSTVAKPGRSVANGPNAGMIRR